MIFTVAGRMACCLALVAALDAFPFRSAFGSDTAPAVNYTRDIRPILSRKCFTCHGPDESAREAGLRLDLREEALSTLESGSVALVPEDPEGSELYLRLQEDDFLRMPPTDSGHSLSSDEIALIRRWIEQGALYERHWSFEPIGRPQVPSVADASWARNEIDLFILHRLEREGIAPSPSADRATLIRRLSLDLIGLPPTPSDVDAFEEDHLPGAYERLVDRLLASPHFGERWGRHWLDLARYADSDGYLGDDLRNYAYRFRDWTIAAINDDLPFDEFTILQIAGDLVDGANVEDQIAAGFHRQSMKNTEAGADRELDRVVRTVDRVSTLGTVWLGLTVGCAECHSHKFDPVSHEEFYSLYAFFNNLEEVDLPAPLPEELTKYEQDLKTWSAEKESVTRALDSLRSEAVSDDVLEILSKGASDRNEEEQAKIDRMMKSAGGEERQVLQKYEAVVGSKPVYPKTQAPTVKETGQRKTFVHLRGDYRQRGEQVQPGTPAVLHPFHPRDEQPDRLDLARWIVDENNPLTPRTTVNRVWMRLFGRGFVSTVDNLGVSGESPSHPELLDWLARKFVEEKLTRKQLIRLIVTSSTYRQASTDRPDLVQRDPLNVLLGRQSRLRLEAEIVRDAALSVSGLLNMEVGGPSFRPPMNMHLAAVSRNREWEVSEGAERYRRGMYILFRRATPYPMLTLFDTPDSTVACAQRERSNSPLQALTLLNDPVFFECAMHFGASLASIKAHRPEDWIEFGFRQCLGRTPTSLETQRLVSLYREQRALLADASINEVRKLLLDDEVDLEPREYAARVVVARSLMNLDEFITRE